MFNRFILSIVLFSLMMKHTSQTGLLSSVTKRLERKKKSVLFELEVDAKHAPYTTKPFTGLFNPYAKGCSILCNHPAVPEVKRMLQKAKENLGEEGKSVILPAEIAAIRAELEEFHIKTKVVITKPVSSNQIIEAGGISDIVPEELFRKYTETDSRPLTPTPTLASAHTRASATRRCVTPDPIITTDIKEKTLLVLDLRRSHSQETLSCYGGSAGLNEIPLIRIMNVNLTPASSRHSLLVEKRQSQIVPPAKTTGKCIVQSDEKSRLQFASSNLSVPCADEIVDSDNEDEYIKRRGRKRKKRRASSSVSIFRVSTDPETLVAGLTTDSKNPSARPSLNEQHTEELSKFVKQKLDSDRGFNIDSFLDYESLRQLRRELTSEVIDMEFDDRRKLALKEALRTISNMRADCEELKQIQKNIIRPEIDSEFRFGLPQKFSRSSVRFELPMDSRTLNKMTPMDYIKEHVFISSARKLLYVFVFNLHRMQPATEEATDDQAQKDKISCEAQERSNINDSDLLSQNIDVVREISGAEINSALGVLMGKPLTEPQATELYYLLGWPLVDTCSFQTFSAICAVCERLFAAEFYPCLPGKEEDPCQTIEIIDFESLEMKIRGKTMDERLTKLLYKLKSA